MKKTTYLASTLACLASLHGSAALPRHCWNFDKLEWNSKLACDMGASGSKILVRGRLATGQGAFGSDALRVDADGTGEIWGLSIAWPELTFGCSLRFATAPTGVRPLFDCRMAEKGEPAFSVLFDNGRLTVRAGDFTAASAPLGLTDGVRYEVRVAVSRDGGLKAWLDGREVIARAGAPTPAVFAGERAVGRYPILSFGGERDAKSSLDGVMDDIYLDDKALGAPEKRAAGADCSRIALPEWREVPATEGSEALVFDVHGKAATGRFRVADVMDANVFGQMNAADRKYVKAAASATMCIADGRLEITVDCPVPPGEKINRNKSLWCGDYVEIDLKPSANDLRSICYCINASGLSSCEEFGGKRPGWTPHAKMAKSDTPNGYRVTVSAPLSDVFDAPLKPGDTFGINFIRCGPTCGGKSSWATFGGAYNDAQYAYGTAVVGGAAAFFRRRLDDVRVRAEKTVDGDAARAAVAAACRPVAAAIDAHAGNVANFASLEKMFGALDRAFLAISLQGRSLLVYHPDDSWGNAPEPKFGARPLDLIRIRTPRNCKSVFPFALANFRGELYTGNVKVFDRYDSFLHTGRRDRPRPAKGVARGFKLRRAVRVCGQDDRPIFDPLVDLPVGSLVEIAPSGVAPLFAELDTHGVAAGRYYAVLMVKSATPGFPDERVGVEVTVTDDDLDEIALDKMGWTHLAMAFGADSCTPYPTPNCIRRLVERGYNMIMFTRIDDIYPTMDEKGVWRAPSYEVADRFVDAWLAGGLDPKRMKFVPYIAVERERPQWRGLRDHKGERVPFGTPAHDEGLRAMVRFFAAHAKAKYGVGKDRIVWIPVDEANGKLADPEFKSSVSRCAHAGKVIRSEDPANVIYWNPLPRFIDTDEFRAAAKELSSVFDILDLYRPALSAKSIKAVQAVGYRQVWGSHITGRQTSPDVYRVCAWQSLRDGFGDLINYWHLDESASFSPGNGYASCYLDWDLDELTISRRQLAADMSAEEGRLIRYLRLKAKDDPAKKAKIESIVKTAADAGTMAAMDAALAQLLDLL